MKKTRYNAQHSRRFRVNLRKVLCFGLVLVMAATMLPASTPAALAQGPDEEVSMMEAAAPAGEMPADLEETMPADEPPTDSIAEPNIAFAEMQNLSSTAPAELQDEPETASIEPQNESDTASAESQTEPNTVSAELQDEPSTETAEPQDEPYTAAAEAQNEPEEDTDKQEDTVYANSIGGTLWLDVFEDKDSGAHNGDGIRQPEEEPFADYEVSLYLADDKESPVDTVTTDSNGEYIFENLEPGTYVVGLSACTKDDVEYLLPIVGTNDDTQLFSDYNDDYTTVYSKPIVIDADTVVTDIDVGMRTPMGVQPAGIYSTLTINPAHSTAAVSGTVPATWSVRTTQAATVIGDLSGLAISYKKSTDSTWISVSVPVSTSFSFNLSGLSQSTAYTIRVQPTYTWRGGWYIDGSRTLTLTDTYSFTTKATPAPTVGAASRNVATLTHTVVSASANVNTYGRGGSAIWQYSTGGGWANIGTQFAIGDGTRTTTISGLPSGKNCYVRLAVYVNGVGWIYGGQSPAFTTVGKPTKGPVTFSNVTQNSVKIGATFNANRGSSTNSNVYICDHQVYYRVKGTSAWTQKNEAMGGTVTGTGKISGTGSGTLTGLQPNTTYQVYWGISNKHIRNDDVTITEFTTLPLPPTIDSFYPAVITTNDAQLQGTYSSATAITKTEYRVNLSGSWEARGNDLHINYAGPGTFSPSNFAALLGTSLQPNKRYGGSVQLYNAGGASPWQECWFVTMPDFTAWQPTPDNADATKATVSGTYAGDQPITAATICYGTSETDVENDAPGTTLLTGGTDFTFDNDDFSANLTGLIPGQTYYVKTTVTNATGTTTSTIKPFHMPGMQFTVSNTVTGSYADKTKDFVFTLTMTDNADVPLSGASVTHAGGTVTLDGNGQATFTLKHGESIEFTDILGTSKILVEETPVTGYTASYDLDSGGVQTGDSTGFIDVNSLDHTAAFTNERGNIVPTGFELNSTGLALLIGIGVILIVGGLFIKKASRRVNKGRH